ncbi:MAG: tetratricopeptide repeat protein [Candidatus Cloacimonetes bacterium]|nr:tetratricopeptide repeat protein [Candidatus Cloacimonadota bacterium]MBS3766571.1 tetratricopeptide repeat protein [Candidatus Cloacimonadota bacterium]
MKRYFGLFPPKRCKVCKDHKAMRDCKKLNKKICFHCCNEIRIKMDCPLSCKYAIKEKEDNTKLSIKNYSESIAEQQELLDLHLNKWLYAENPQFDNKTPIEFAKTKQGKEQIAKFLDKKEQNLKFSLNYNFLRDKLDIKKNDNIPITHEDVASKFLDLLVDYDYEKTIPLLVNKDVYESDEFKKNYIKRNLDTKAVKAIKEYDLLRSALNEHEDEAIVEFEINGKYELSIVLAKINNEWLVAKKIFGESGTVLAENETRQRIVNYFSKDKFHKGYKDLKKNLKVYVDSADLHYYMGIYYSTKGKIEKARQYFFNAVELDPDFVEAKYNYAFLFQAEGNIEKAKILYEEILEKKEDLKTLNNLAVIYEQQGDVKDAEILLKKALKIDPDFEFSQKNLERVSKKLNQDEQTTVSTNPSQSNK